MSEQREKPMFTPEQLAAVLGISADGAKCSGGQFENFRAGWAKNIEPGTSGTVAHYFERKGFDVVVALCGAQGAVRWMYGAGNYPRCSRCLPIANRRLRYL